jgi:hypothetical protein
MDTIVYLITAFITVIWSVWIYLWWERRAGLPEESGLRLLLIVAPSTYFLLIAVSGWSGVRNLRLDIAGLIVLDILTFVTGALLVTLLSAKNVSRRPAYLSLVGLYNLFAILEVIFLYLVRSDVGLLVRVAAVVGEWGRLDFLSFSWIAARGHASQPDLVGLLNKILIALLSYIPVSLIRYIASVRRRRKLERELAVLRAKVESLERRMADREGV